MVALLWLALLGPPPLDEIVERTVAVMDRQPPHMVCKLRAELDALDKKGSLEEHRETEFEETRRGERVESKVVRATVNGKDSTAEAQARAAQMAERRKQKEERGQSPVDRMDLVSPFSIKGRPRYQFAFVREESLWGRRAFVVKVTSRERKRNEAEGNSWIDAETFVVLKTELVPASLPDKHLDWLKVQTQHALHPSGFALPTLFKVEGAGHYLFMKKAFRSTLRWSECKDR
jgi:hypothetical protein